MRFLFSKEKINKILTKSDIVRIIGSKIPVSNSGSNYKAQCPFHEEKTPSFFINTTKQFYYCFGCGAHGNCINFLMRYNRISFFESVTYLSKEANLEILPHIKEKKEHQGYIYSIMNYCLDLYKTNLNDSQEVQFYLKKRGINTSSIEKFDIGYSIDSWNGLNRSLDKKTEFSLIKTGMRVKNGNKVYDRFRNRIMFPVKDIYGNIVGFGGRSKNDLQPKYINSPETKIFHKGNELYGLYELGASKTPLKKLLVVEGYIDVVTLHQYGVHAVAILGTAINIKQIKKCLKYTKELVFCFDGDTAGRRAAWKTMKVVLSILGAGVQIRFLFLPEGDDPDSLIRRIGKDRFEEYINNSSVFTEIFFDIIKKKFSFSSLESKIRYANIVTQYIERAPKGFAQEIMKSELANKLHLTKDIIGLACLKRKDHTYFLKDLNKNNDTRFSERFLYLLLEEPKAMQNLHGWRFLLFTDVSNIQIISSLIFSLPANINVQNLMLSTLTRSEKTSIIKIREKIKSTDLEITYKESVHLFKRLKTCYVQQKVAELMLRSKKYLISPDELKILQMILRKI